LSSKATRGRLALLISKVAGVVAWRATVIGAWTEEAG
jgi:hypothetical protein